MLNAIRRQAGGPGVQARFGRTVLKAVMCGGVAMAASGCSLSFPIAGFVTDPIATGSINRSSALLNRELDQEDWRRAKAALAVALDPQGSGTSVGWSNPATGARGSFTAAAPPVATADAVCRAFAAEVTAAKEASRQVHGSACRGRDGEWAVAEAREGGSSGS